MGHLQLLNATVGGSILIPCTVSVNMGINLIWLYWQEYQSDIILFHWEKGATKPVNNRYTNRCQVFDAEFSSRNISIRLDTVSVGDDNKTFWAFVHFYDKQKNVSETKKQLCKSTLQVSGKKKFLVSKPKSLHIKAL